MKKDAEKKTGKKKMKKSVKSIIIIAVIAVAAAGGVLIYSSVASAAEQDAAFNTTPTFDQITTGDISLSVSGSGNLASAETLDIISDSYLVVDDVLVAAGDTIEADQAVVSLDTEAMQTYADDLEAQIVAQQISIDTTNSVTTQLSIKSPSDGWVKNVMLDEDDYIEDAMEETGYVALVATEAREIIIAQDSGLAEGTAVTVQSEGYTHAGVVTSENGALYVSINTVKRTVGADAVVYDTDGNELFTGKIELAAFEPIESSYGIITDVNFSEDESIDAGETIYSAEQYSQDVTDMYEALNDLKDQYEAITTLIAAGQVTSPSAGVVSAVAAADGQVCEEDTTLISVESTDSWIATVSVDELDINSIEVGQSVDVELDSMPNDVFEGTVESISDMGTASSGITTYSVDVTVEDNESFKLNMTLNCEIMAQEATGAVLAPVDDVRSTGNMSYVMVKLERSEDELSAIKQLILANDMTGLAAYMGDDAAALGINILSDPSELLYAEVRAVETGIEDAYNIEIISGLTEGESILQPASTDSDSISEMFPQMGNMGAMQGEFPGGGERPSGAGMPAGN